MAPPRSITAVQFTALPNFRPCLLGYGGFVFLRTPYPAWCWCCGAPRGPTPSPWLGPPGMPVPGWLNQARAACVLPGLDLRDAGRPGIGKKAKAGNFTARVINFPVNFPKFPGKRAAGRRRLSASREGHRGNAFPVLSVPFLPFLPFHRLSSPPLAVPIISFPPPFLPSPPLSLFLDFHARKGC